MKGKKHIYESSRGGSEENQANLSHDERLPGQESKHGAEYNSYIVC
jgi:hypothetical protein